MGIPLKSEIAIINFFESHLCQFPLKSGEMSIINDFWAIPTYVRKMSINDWKADINELKTARRRRKKKKQSLRTHIVQRQFMKTYSYIQKSPVGGYHEHIPTYVEFPVKSRSAVINFPIPT